MNKFLANKILIIFCIILSVIITNVLISFWDNSKIDCTKEKKYTFRASLPGYFKKMLITKRLNFQYLLKNYL